VKSVLAEPIDEKRLKAQMDKRRHRKTGCGVEVVNSRRQMAEVESGFVGAQVFCGT
jgi:hypothetical protein